MALTSDDIGRIAHLARLELSADESERMLTRLNDFFGIVEAMGGRLEALNGVDGACFRLLLPIYNTN